DQLVFRLVDAGDVLERHLRPVFLVVAARAALADAEQAAAEPAAELRGAPVHPDVEEDQQERRPEAVEKRRERAALDRHRADLDLVLDQERLEPGTDERRQRRRERSRLARLAAGGEEAAARRR